MGVASSSVTVSWTAAGSATPRPPDASAVTVTVRSALSMSSFAGSRVTAVPLLAVCPAAMVSVLLTDSAAPVPVAATVRVTAWSDGWLRRAVTATAEPDSDTLAEAKCRVAVGSGSSSAMVTVACDRAPRS